jgi:hypothetical protein
MPQRHTAFTSWLLLCVLLLQATLPFLVLAQNDDTARALGEKILICSGATSRWIDWQDLEKGKAPAHPNAHEPSCVLCTPAGSHNSADASLPVLTAPLTNIVLTTRIDFIAPHLRAERFAAEHPSRAPPLG